ncbi:WD40-repeat-containing domain protein [Coprinopsis sp. MPI-PUGE-AT-0042]|nr:WD40-repeat-containing domain protein [Coprinopsis sp. MPI-PUGE-AT-0042]
MSDQNVLDIVLKAQPSSTSTSLRHATWRFTYKERNLDMTMSVLLGMRCGKNTRKYQGHKQDAIQAVMSVHTFRSSSSSPTPAGEGRRQCAPPSSLLHFQIHQQQAPVFTCLRYQACAPRQMSLRASFELAVAFSPDGTHVASGSRDSSVRVWDVSPHFSPRYNLGSVGWRPNHAEYYTGWLLSPTDSSARLMFVPPAAHLPDDRNVLTLPASAVPHLDLSTAKLGDRWAECYTPMSVVPSSPLFLFDIRDFVDYDQDLFDGQASLACLGDARERLPEVRLVHANCTEHGDLCCSLVRRWQGYHGFQISSNTTSGTTSTANTTKVIQNTVKTTTAILILKASSSQAHTDEVTALNENCFHLDTGARFYPPRVSPSGPTALRQSAGRGMGVWPGEQWTSTQGLSPPNFMQGPEATPFPQTNDTRYDPPPSLPEFQAARAQNRPPRNPSPQEGFDGGLPQSVNYGPTYNIGTAGNVFAGVNYGPLTMISDNEAFILKLRDRLKVSIRADHMYYAGGEESALRHGSCTPGTRVNILQGVTHWATNTSAHSEIVYWLSGQGGAGKTTIAYTVARQFETLFSDGYSRVILGGSFFCSRQFLDTRSASSIIRTIVYQLALRSKAFQDALKAYGRFETVDHGPQSQIMGLLIEPWRMSAAGRLAENEPCYVIPIDALDELEGTGGTEFLGTLFDVLEKEDLSGLKFFVTSRSDPALVKRIASFSNKQVCRLEEVPLEESSADIKLYLTQNLSECANDHQIQQLVSDAAGLFIYAATVVEHVKGRDVAEQESLLKRLLSSSSSTGAPRGATAMLDNLYLQILQSSLVDPRDRDDPETFESCLSILHTVLCTVERISTTIAVGILNASRNHRDTVLDDGTAEGVVHRLHAVLYSEGGQIMWFHKSFADFLFDQGRAQRFFCNREQHHRRLALGCFGIMEEQLRFNIADISSSHQLDRDNLALSSNIHTNISMPLRYACGYWSSHFALTSLEKLDGLVEALNEFLWLQILFWMEAMNLLGQRGRCQAMLRDTQQRFSKSKDSAELVDKLADAAAFAAYYSTSKAALSIPHLYISSLATFSRRSPIVENWRRQFRGIPKFINAEGAVGEILMACISIGQGVRALALSPDGTSVAVASPNGLVRRWDLSTGEEIKGHTSRVNAVACSPDGTHIVSSSNDKSVRVWNPSTGGKARVFNGHDDSIWAVAYSPDGSHVVSGSDDKSVRVWNLSTGENERVLQGHTDFVRAVAYSCDGTHIASGSYDNSVRVWDTSTGENVGVLKGHTKEVNAVAFSPDGTHVVSGSKDKSVRVWHLSTGLEVKILKGHGDWVNSVAYSPAGSHVASGSDDKSVRVWSLSMGAVKVLKGHNGTVWAVAYLPDGTRVVSGSGDKTVRVWDLSAGEVVTVVKGHAESVNAVAYSPDGTCIASCSTDKSVRVWDVSNLEEVMVLHGHTKGVNAMAFSPDGTHIVSGSQDKSVQVWDLLTGKVARLFHGHTDAVNAVAYSPDGTHVVSGSGDRSVRLWNLAAGKEVGTLKDHTHIVSAVCHSPDGTRIVSGGHDSTVRVWDLSTGAVIWVLRLNDHRGGVTSVAYSPDGTQVVSGSNDGTVCIWNLLTGGIVWVLNAYAGIVHAVAYSPSATHVVSGSVDHSIRVWDLSTGKEAQVVHGHTGCVNAVAYSPGGTLVSGSSDNSVRLWNVSPDFNPRYIRQRSPDGGYTGWLVSPTDSSALLMFVRPEAHLPDDSNILTIPASAVPHLDFSNAKLGDRWAECYTPTLNI